MSLESPDDADLPGESVVALEHARAAILRYLAERDGRVENVALVTVAVRTAELDRRGCAPADLPITEVNDLVRAEHLPALAREGLVDFDRVDESVALTATPDDLDAALSRDERGR